MEYYSCKTGQNKRPPTKTHQITGQKKTLKRQLFVDNCLSFYNNLLKGNNKYMDTPTIMHNKAVLYNNRNCTDHKNLFRIGNEKVLTKPVSRLCVYLTSNLT